MISCLADLSESNDLKEMLLYYLENSSPNFDTEESEFLHDIMLRIAESLHIK